MNTWLIAALWMGLALAAALGSVQFGISVALVEILLGFLAGNTFHLNPTPWTDFLAGTGSVLLTFLAGAEIDPDVLRGNFRESLLIGFFSFLAPALGTRRPRALCSFGRSTRDASCSDGGTTAEYADALRSTGEWSANKKLRICPHNFRVARHSGRTCPCGNV